MHDSDHPPFGELAIPEFIPVPLRRSRRDGWTPERQNSFIATLANTGCVAAAARSAGMGVTSAYALRRRPGACAFATAWDIALRDARHRALEVAMRTVFSGALSPRTYRGNFTGTLIRKDDIHATLAALRAATSLSSADPPK
jgi:hypothetical protein